MFEACTLFCRLVYCLMSFSVFLLLSGLNVTFDHGWIYKCTICSLEQKPLGLLVFQNSPNNLGLLDKVIYFVHVNRRATKKYYFEGKS